MSAHHFAWTAVAAASLSLSASAGTWTIVETFEIPESASGLAWDGTWLYCGIYGVDGGRVYRIDPADGSSTLLFTGPQEDAYGLTYDGANLWTTDHPGSTSTPAVAYKLDWDGTLLDQINLPDHYTSGIAWDAGELWVSRYHPNPGHLYRLSLAGAILDDFAGPDDQPWDLAVQDDTIWIADYFGDAIYQIDATTAAVLTSRPSEGVDPAGVVWDGQFLWYCDNGTGFDTDALYKVDPSGVGTPQIDVPSASHDYGTVAIGDSSAWNMTINNNGNAPLEITSIDFDGNPDLSTTTSLPLMIPAGMDDQLAIVFAPGSFGALDTTVMINSSDPVTRALPVSLTGAGVFTDPTIGIGETTHNFGIVRATANTRWFVEITNQGLAELTISDISSDDSRFYIDQAVQTPVMLGSLESIQLGIWFAPGVAGAANATIGIDSNDTTEGISSILVSGTGDDSPSPIGDSLWTYLITAGFDNSPKGMIPIDDVSGDGKSDVIVGSEDGYVRCLNANSHSTADVLWETDLDAGSVFSQSGIDTIADIDGDDHEDVVVGTTGRIIRALSGCTGEEIWTHDTSDVGDGGWVYTVDAQFDYNEDGIVDVIAGAGDDAADTGPKRVYCIDGTNGISIWERPIGGPVFVVLSHPDFTGDGFPDVIAGVSNADETQGRAVGINGETSGVSWNYFIGGSSVWGLALLEDLNGDTVQEVMVGDFSTGIAHGVSGRTGGELFTTAGGYGIITRLERLDDVNGDGHPDIAPVHSGDFTRVVSGFDGTTIWTTPVADNSSAIARLPDIDGDGVNDLAVGTLFTNNATYFLGGADGAVLDSDPYPTPVDAITTVPDVTEDGSWEMVIGGRNGLVTCRSGGTAVPPNDPADVDDDGDVDVDDLIAVILAWGNNPGNPADVNGDDVVDVDDLIAVILAWTG